MVARRAAVGSRAPLNRDALQRWKRFEPQLWPLRDLLEREGVRTG